ncbi:site-specific integrase [Microbacterium sp. zg-Y818]|uniref:tyrosine-type recombinase/integrase n=1 Tax=unclassified Microbacterium TaxID=2609290 RepID=UPI00214B74FE|nr:MULTISPECIES: site-specific integrase [unclassified Microbacterium]MCR2801173.1 site-specific integrase [Microbacterium sp. zg.Y818]WIM21009.1 site-specific integrase [Microbacterium sp. zg-Y818]
MKEKLHAGSLAVVAGAISPTTTIEKLAEAYLEEAARIGSLAPTSLERYRWVIAAHIIPGIGQLRVREATAGTMDRFLAGMYSQSLANGKLCRAVLSNMLGIAVRHGALPGNPIRDVARAPKPRIVMDVDPAEESALSVDAVAKLRADLQTWLHEPHQMGPRRSADLPDVVDFMLGTGCRIGEALAIRWDDLDLRADRPTAAISGTVVQVTGEGLKRQAARKGGKGRLVVTLPRFTVDMLLRRRVESTASPYVFPSETGGLRSPNNWRRTWRGFKADMGYSDDLSPHDFRKTVATILDREHGASDSAKVLGHSSPVMTEKHYIQQNAVAPDVSETLQRFADASR